MPLGMRLVSILLLLELSNAQTSDNNQTYVEKDSCESDEGLLVNEDLDIGICVNCTFFTELRPVGSIFIGGPGYVCIDKEIQLCELGHYCPFNEETQAYDIQLSCGSGDWCPPGMTEPIRCDPLYVCNGSTIAFPIGGIIFIVVMILLLIILYCFNKRRMRIQLHRSAALQAQFVDEDVKSIGSEADLTGAEQVSITFDGVGLSLKSNGYQVLQGVTGHFPQHSMVAIMGASGSGKTTFMNAVINRAPYGNIEGNVKINGVDNGLDRAGNHIGFVPQDNIVHSNLTIYQNLLYHALLRLPRSFTLQQREEQVARVLKVLGLHHVQDCRVGNEEKRGISGGQKKRVNIGMELVALPSVLFMDEPTSGLDGAATIALARVLSLLRQSGITIICVIHQPRWAVFSEFTHLLLLGDGGKQVYSGRVDLVEPYFNAIGFERPVAESPADWIIDVCCNLESRRLPDGTVDESFECPRDLFVAWDGEHRATALSHTSRWHESDADPAEVEGRVLHRRPAPGLRTAIYYLTGRAFRQISVSDLIVTVIILFIVGMVLSIGSVIGDWSWSSLPNRLVGPNLIYAIIIGVTHRADYGNQKVILYREANSGISPIAIFAAMTFRTWVVVFLKAFSFATVIYLLSAPLQPFGSFLMGWYGLTLWWASTAHWVSLCTSQNTGTVLLLFAPIFEALLSGDVGGDGDPEELEGLTTRNLLLPSWFTAGRWQFQALYASEIQRYPEHVRTFTAVNASLYWRYIPDDLEGAAMGGFFAIFGFAWWNFCFLGGHLLTLCLLLLLPENNMKVFRRWTACCRAPFIWMKKCCRRSPKKPEMAKHVAPLPPGPSTSRPNEGTQMGPST